MVFIVCIFCEIIKGNIPSKKIYENDDVLAILDISQITKGHTLVMPKRHYDNLLDISDEDLSKAINTSQAYEFINALEEGIDTSIASKGTNISGGQKQRLLIARALAGSPEILVLDDSSSALDYKTDSMLRSSIRQNYGSITSIIISQRISSIMNCDYIMMIDSGIVLGYGKHEYLLNTLKEYRQIYMAQMGNEVHHE